MLSGAYRCRTGRSARDRRRRRPARTPLRAAAQEQAGVPAGRWTGRGLAALGLATGEEVTEARLRTLFGERGRHPYAKGVPRRRVRHRPCCPFRGRAAPPVPTPRRAAGKGRTERPEGQHSFSSPRSAGVRAAGRGRRLSGPPIGETKNQERTRSA
ncbi:MULTISPECIES: relaxase domain-containing protein [Streptomyces]|uniref:relaxase domain-containing protein n=1 Tax=Streptomyces TaxID=1883 RepID=UPI000D1A3651|nr:relaxase domain-containing protein [Streptomyces sp. gb14]